MLVAMKDATKLKVATAVTVLFLAAISVAGLVNRSGDAGEGDEDEGYENDADEGYEEDDD